MDIPTLIAGIGIVVVIGFTFGVIHLITKRRKSQKDVRSDDNSGWALRGIRLDWSMVSYMNRADLAAFETRAKEGLHHGLSSEELSQIIAQINQQVAVIDARKAAEAAHRTAIQPALADLAALRTVNLGDPDEARKVFNRLHQIKIGEDLLRYDDIIDYGDELDEWFAATYSSLLRGRFRALIQEAREGSIEAYLEVMKLYRGLDDVIVDIDGDTIDGFIDENFLAEWNAMIVRYLRLPEWGPDSLHWNYDWEEGDYLQILKEARAGDLLCLQYVRLMLEDDDSDLAEAMKDLLRAETTEALEAQHRALGFDGPRHPGLPT